MPTHPTRENTLSNVTRRFGVQLGHRWGPGDRLPPVRDLAAEMGASHGTVYRALNQLVERGVLIAKPRQGLFVSARYSDAQLRAVAKPAVQSTNHKNDNIIAGKRVTLCYTHISTHMHAARHALDAELSSRGCVVTHLEFEQAVPLAIAPSQMDALVLINPDAGLQISQYAHLPLVIATSAASHPQYADHPFDLIQPDQYQGAALAGKYFREMGINDVCFVGVNSRESDNPSSVYETTCEARLKGFLNGWSKPLPDAHLLKFFAYSTICGALAAKSFAKLKARPRGVFAASDDLAIGFISGAEALGLRHGKDYHLVGFDGQLQLNELYPDGVPSVVVPAELMGRYAADMLLSRWSNPSLPSRKFTLGCSLRQSVSNQSTHVSSAGTTASGDRR